MNNNAENTNQEDQVLFLYTQLMNLPFSETETIMQIEQSLYQEHNANPQDRLAIIGLLQAEIMLGNRKKAQSFAYLLWDMGEGISLAEELLYINNLIDLGLLDMASELLKPRFENLSQNIENFFAIMLKFSIMSGNIYWLENLLKNPHAPYQEVEYGQIISHYKNYGYVEHFKNIMKIIQEKLKGKLCACEYNITGSKNKDLEIFLYLGQDINEIEEIQKTVQEAINSYNKTVGIEKISNFNWTLYPIAEHFPMGLD